jgi:PAS domain S-box-containing protein
VRVATERSGHGWRGAYNVTSSLTYVGRGLGRARCPVLEHTFPVSSDDPADSPDGPSVAQRRVLHLVDGLRYHATFLLSPQGHVETWSASAERVTGYPGAEVVGKHVSFLFLPSDVAAGEPGHELAQAEQEGEFQSEVRRLRKDGSCFVAQVSITAMRGDDGQGRGFVVSIHDLSEQRRADRMLHLSEERFRLLVDSVEDYAIFMLTPDGQVATWNAGAQRMKGYSAEEIIGESHSRFYPPEDREAGRPGRLLRTAVEAGRVEDEGWRVRKDGSWFWADVVLSAVRGPRGELIGFSKVTRDLTRRRATEERVRLSEERFRLLVQSVKDYAIFMLDPLGRIVTWNAGAARINGYQASEIIGQHFSRFYPEEDVRSGKCERELEIASIEGRYEEEGWRVRKDGTRFWSSVVITALRDPGGALIGYGKVTRDLTQRRRLEEERVRLVQAEESIRLRDEFLSIASHELKTPLTALQLQLQGLAPRVGALDPAMVPRFARAIRSGQRLSDLIEALLDVSRIATGRFELKRELFDMGEAVRDLVERLRDSATKSGCELVVTAPEGIVGAWDRLRIEQVLVNLLSNALKYGAGNPVRVEVTRDGPDALIEVRDAGPGIREEDLARIFGRFERASSIRHYGGLGLGLYVAREIVEAHHGAVSAQNSSGGGAVLVVRLPIRPQLSPDSPPADSLHH